MLSQPFQNSDMFHRTEVVSDLRTAQAQRDQGAQEHAAALQRRREELRESGVEKTKELELDPDRLPDREQPKRQRQKRKKGAANGESSEATPEAEHPIPHRNLGAGHIDLTA